MVILNGMTVTYHSDYNSYGFKIDEIADFLFRHEIDIQAGKTPIYRPAPFPDWAAKYRGLRSFRLTDAAEIIIFVNPSGEGFLGDQAQADCDIAMQLLEQAIEDGTLRTGKDINGKTTVFDSELRPWCRSIGRVWCIPAVDPLPDVTTDEALLQSLQEVQREKAELVQQLVVLQRQHDDREVLKQRASTLAKDVVRLEGEKAALQVELENIRADILAGKNKTTLLTLVGGLAMIGCGMDIHSSRLKGINEMINDLASVGISVKDDTVRLHLKAAAELIPKPK